MTHSPHPPTPAPKRVLVTGAAKRLGRHIALTLARGGWSVVVHYHQSSQEAQATVAECQRLGPEGTHSSACADLGEAQEADALMQRVCAQPLHAVVNSASLFVHDRPEAMDVALMQRHWQVNTLAPALLTQALAAHCRAQQHRGVVVNLLDQKLYNPNPDFFGYTLSKAALACATTLGAQALAPHLRVVGVAPGLTLTSHMLSDEAFAKLHQLSPLGQSSTPNDVANTVAFALNNGSITGSTLLVDGGQHLVPMARDFSLMSP
ncbi:MAG: SDR family oxidoreductase [Burkholderiaceae bacterium]